MRAALLWGVVSGLAFIVLLQGYYLTGGTSVGLPASASFTAVAAVGGGALAYVAERWFARRWRGGNQVTSTSGGSENLEPRDRTERDREP